MGKEREKPPVQKFTRRDFLIFAGLGTVGSIVIPWTLQKLKREIEITKDIFLPIFLPMVGDLIHLKSCDIRVVKDFDPQYDIDTEELKRLFEDNGVFCPYWIFVTIKPKPFWVKKIIKDHMSRGMSFYNELQCDRFANENYQKYQLVIEQK